MNPKEMTKPIARLRAAAEAHKAMHPNQPLPSVLRVSDESESQGEDSFEMDDDAFEAENFLEQQNIQRLQKQNAQKQAKRTLDPKVKNSFLALLGLKRQTEDVEVGGVKYTLQSITNKELTQILNTVKSSADLTSQALIANAMKVEYLVYAWCGVDGKDVDDFISSIEEKRDAIENMDAEMTDILYETFVSLRDKLRSTVSKETFEGEAVSNLKK